MDYIQILGFTLVTLLLIVSPGPNGLLVIKTVSTLGQKSGFANVAGFIASFYLHGALSVLGISVILTNSAEAFFVVKVIGAMYLSWMGIKSLISAFNKVDQVQVSLNIKKNKTLTKSFLSGFLTNVLNPKVSMFYLAAFPQFIPADENAIFYAFLLVSIHAIMNLLWFTSMILLFSKISSVSKNEFGQRILKGITGIVFIGFGAKLLTLESQ